MEIAGQGFLEKSPFERSLKRTGGMNICREGKKLRKEGRRGSVEDSEKQQSCFWFGFSVSCRASQARKQTLCVMLTLPASCPKCTGLMYVPANNRPAALYLTPGHPFLAIQNLSKPTHPTLSSSVQVLKYRAASEEAFSNVLFSGCLPPQCVLTPRPLPVWSHQLSGNIHHTGDAVLPCTGNWVGACMRTQSLHL